MSAIALAAVARTLSWTHRVVVRASFSRLLAGEEPQLVAVELRREARRAYDLVEGGLAGYGASRSAATNSASSSAA